MPSLNHLTYSVADHYPASQFQELSKKVSRSKSKRPPAPLKKPKISPREEIYKSMLREIKNGERANMESLVHKASGILRLQHYRDVDKARKASVSWDMDGRRVLTYEDKGGVEKTLLQRETPLDKARKKNIYNSFNEPIFGLDSSKIKELSKVNKKSVYSSMSVNSKSVAPTAVDVEDESRFKVSKVWEHYINTGDASQLWDSKEGILSNDSRPSSAASTSSLSERRSSYTTTSSYGGVSCPPLEYGRRASKINLYDNRSSILRTTASATGVNTERNNQSSSVKFKRDEFSYREDKVDRVLHICVVNGSVVTFKDFGFENFTNWFGDESMLEANQQRTQPKFHLELDLTDVENKDIKIRLLSGYKLEVEARRRLGGSHKSIRIRDTLLLPKGHNPEDLLMFRTKSGKLVVEDNTAESAISSTISTNVVAKSKSSSKKASKATKSQSKWRIPSSATLEDQKETKGRPKVKL